MEHQEQRASLKTAVEFLPLYERMRLKQPMDLIGDFDNGTTHMNHYRFYYFGEYLDCYASTEKSLIEVGKRNVTEELTCSDVNFAAAMALCNRLNEGYHAGKVLCCPDYDTKTIYFDIWAQSLTPQELDQLNYMLDSTLLLVDILTDEVTKLIKSHKEGSRIF